MPPASKEQTPFSYDGMIRIRFTGEGAVPAQSQPDPSGPPKSVFIVPSLREKVKPQNGTVFCGLTFSPYPHRFLFWLLLHSRTQSQIARTRQTAATIAPISGPA